MSLSVSGILQDETGTPVTSNAFIRFYMRFTGGNQPFVAGTALISPSGAQGGAVWYADFVPNGSGAISGTLYSTSDVTVGGQTGVIAYGMVVYKNGVPGVESIVSASGNININNPNILTLAPVVPAPTGDSTYLRLDASNSPVTGQPTFKTGFLVSGATSGNTTIAATAIASGTLTLPAATDQIVGRATSDTLTNKTIDGGSNTLTLTPQKFIFTNNGTFTIPTGVKAVKVTVVGGGGAGGGGTNAANFGAGGGAGGAAIKWLSGLTPGNTLAVTVGGAGAAGAGNGGNGGLSSVASGTQTISTISGGGGTGGVSGNSIIAGGAGGGGTGGDVNFTGNYGGTSYQSTGGQGAGSIFGGMAPAAGGAGIAGTTYGAGGGGAGTSGTNNGGAGFAGIVIFEWVN